MYMCMEKEMKGNDKDEVLQKANLVRNCKSANIAIVITTINVCITPAYAYCNQKQNLEKF